MSDARTHAPLRYAQPPDLGRFCRPVARVAVLDTQDAQVGLFDGLILQGDSDRPLYLVLREQAGDRRALVPIGSAWFDQTSRAIRIDRAALVDDVLDVAPDGLERMPSEEVAQLERRILASCCPEELRAGGSPAYTTAAFQCPEWLQPANLNASQVPQGQADTPE